MHAVSGHPRPTGRTGNWVAGAPAAWTPRWIHLILEGGKAEIVVLAWIQLSLLLPAFLLILTCTVVGTRLVPTIWTK